MGFLQPPLTPSLVGVPRSFGSKSESKEALFQPIAHNGGGSKIELKEPAFHHNGGGSKIELEKAVIQPIAHNDGGNRVELKELVFPPIAHNGSGNRAELKEPAFLPIAQNGPATILGVLKSCGSNSASKEAVFQAIAHNGPVTMFDGGEQYPCSLESGGKEVGEQYPCKKGGQMSLTCVRTVMSEEEEELDLSLHL